MDVPRLPAAWSRCAGLNRGPRPYHGRALPAELHRRPATGGQVYKLSYNGRSDKRPVRL